MPWYAVDNWARKTAWDYSEDTQVVPQLPTRIQTKNIILRTFIENKPSRKLVPKNLSSKCPEWIHVKNCSIISSIWLVMTGDAASEQSQAK